MSSDNVQASGKAEANASHKWVRESNLGQIQVLESTKKVANFMLGSCETGESLSHRWSYVRFNTPWRLHLEKSLYGWF